MIYADDTCPKHGPAGIKGWVNIPGSFPSITNKSIDWQNESQVYDIYPNTGSITEEIVIVAKVYRSIPVYSQTDDHEVADDYSGNKNYILMRIVTELGFRI